jgi:hypothetical protein
METNYSNTMSGFTKLFSTIVYSTVWQEDMHVKVVWVTLLAMANRHGCVFASVPGLAKAANVSLDQCVEALAKLSSPDEWSRTKTNEGRRIQECDGGWELLNYLKYRERRDDDERRIQTRFAVAKHRKVKKAKPLTVSQGKPEKAQAEAEAEAEAEKRTVVPVHKAPTPTHDFLAWFIDEYKATRQGARYRVTAKHGGIVKALLQTYEPARLRRLAHGLLTTTSDPWIESTDRGIEVLAAKINWLEERLAAWEKARAGREAV